MYQQKHEQVKNLIWILKLCILMVSTLVFVSNQDFPLVREFFHKWIFPPAKIFPWSMKFSTRQEFSLMKEVFDICRFFLDQRRFPKENFFPWSMKVSTRKGVSSIKGVLHRQRYFHKKNFLYNQAIFPLAKIFSGSENFFAG